MFEASPRMPQQKSKRMREYDKFSKDVKDASWHEISEKVSESPDSVILERKKEILENINPEELLAQMPKSSFNQIKEYVTFRGCVFESLVNEEMNREEENSVLGNFILNCLQRPQILGLDPRKMFKNPDHLGVVVDTEKNVAFITGMYEVKVGIFSKRGKKQIETFYKNLEIISERINQELIRLKKEYNFDFIPEGGVVLKADDQIDKFLVMPMPTSQLQNKKFEAKRKKFLAQGWDLKKSVFSKANIGKVTAFLMKYYKDYKDEIDRLRNDSGLHQ